MALRIRFQYSTGSQLGYSIERLGDGMFYDSQDGTFKAAPVAPITGLPEDSGIYFGRYKATLSPTPTSQFTDGDYVVTVHDQGSSNVVVAELAATMQGGDDSTVLSSTSAAPVLANPGFETPALPAGTFQTGLAGASWTFTGPAGISTNKSAYTSGSPPAPEGAQVAILQTTGSISQSVPNWAAGNYTITFQAAQRANFTASNQDFNVLVDSAVVGTFKPSGTSFASYSTAPFAVGRGNHSISFVGLDTAGGDNTSFIDNVQIVAD